MLTRRRRRIARACYGVGNGLWIRLGRIKSNGGLSAGEIHTAIRNAGNGHRRLLNVRNATGAVHALDFEGNFFRRSHQA